MTTPDAQVLRTACESVAACDPILAKAYAEIDLPNWRTADATYQTLARVVVYQLISTKAAEAIWGRILDRYGTVTAADVLQDNQEELRACGLSRPKLAHLNSIAMAVDTGALDFERLARADMDTSRKELLAVSGIGPWTAETFLMNALGRLDAFPVGDVGLMEAYKRLSGAETRPDHKQFSALAETWRPYRAVAAHLLYDWLNANRA
ncbi:MAG: DNA-3-methyladenine glycosylase 2 family protein [Pseudomonadota bacterium]